MRVEKGSLIRVGARIECIVPDYGPTAVLVINVFIYGGRTVGVLKKSIVLYEERVLSSCYDRPAPGIIIIALYPNVEVAVYERVVIYKTFKPAVSFDLPVPTRK